jgi:acyl-CoA reductase-like NAD-dependent aldehyde dehydrogenase
VVIPYEDEADAIRIANDSGIGRQNGIEGFNTYLETKVVGIGA